MPNLFKALGLIYQCSTFYNTYSHMTVLLVKVRHSSDSFDSTLFGLLQIY